MRILVAPQEFKGSVTAREAAEAIAAGLRMGLPGAEVAILPLADGGPGTIDALVSATGGEIRRAEARDPLGRPVIARWGVLGREPNAVIEMAEASGLLLLTEHQRDPTIASTAGTGDLLNTVLDRHFDRILVGMGGSATNDGGAGMAWALGARLLDARGEELPPGGLALASLDRLDVAGLDPRLDKAEIVAMTDVTNPLCGPDGASLAYGPQKGASPKIAQQLDAALAHYAEVVKRDLGMDVLNVPGAGAAGGLGAGLVAFCGATIESGFEVVAEATELQKRVASVDVIVTGEGRLDRQTAFGKTTAGVARLARESGTPVLAIAGSTDIEGENLFDAVFSLSPNLATKDEAMSGAAQLLDRVASTTAAEWIRTNAA